MVKPRNLLLGAIFVGGLLVSNAASAITEEEALNTALGFAGIICATHPEYQSKSGKCDVEVFLYDPSTGEYETYTTIVKKFGRDGLLDGKRWWYGSVIKDGKKVHFGLGMSKHIPKNGLYVKKYGPNLYEIIKYKNDEKLNKVLISYQDTFYGLNNVLIEKWCLGYNCASGPWSGEERKLGITLARVTTLDSVCSILKEEEEVKLTKLEEKALEKCNMAPEEVYCRFKGITVMYCTPDSGGISIIQNY